MFRGLSSRLLLSYVLIILVCLIVVGLSLLLFVRASPLWTRGTALRLEAASRGAVEVVLVEQDPSLCKTLQTIAQKLKADGVRVERGDGVAALRQRGL